MTSSSLERPTRSTGGPRTLGRRPPARYEEYLDGLFTYCLSVLCDHDTATAVLGDVLAIAERHHGRCPADESGRRAWLYALARWACLRSLGEQRRRRPGAHTGRPAAAPEPARVPPEVAERRRAELAALAWPEAAGTTPEQREALELAVRHGLGQREVAAVLSLDPVAARELLASAGCEVERTRAALAVVETGDCPTVARLTGDHQVLLSAALRAELVRHVDDCPRCRRAAERAGAAGPWPGAAAVPAGRLPVVEAPRAAAYVAMMHVPRARAGAPRFGPTGFPMDPKDHAARRDRMRARAVTTTVVAAVVAAPVLALWASYRGTPADGEGQDAARISAREADGPDDAQGGSDGHPYERYENAGNARATADPRLTGGARSPDVSVAVISPGAPAGPALPGQAAPARLTVSARGSGATTLLTLTNEGGSPAAWSLWSDAPWLYVSQASGTLGAGESVTVRIFVDRAHEPAGAWSARVGVNPSGAVVRIDGYGATAPPTSTTRPTTPPPSGTDGPTTPPPTSEPPTSPPPTTGEPTTEPPTTEPTGEPTTEPTPSPTESATTDAPSTDPAPAP
ncbi:BACON domain-containing protein [Streptomyces roseicoloratus]|uniref:BACON domain-containing protein n=1 Tax=Streptomyces roseicoloratus TaxID=2508722 RepID=UPI001009C857|nr:sigma-70 family RNA polymerase sigma factor [Streptomyces roseicoloratus]